MAGMLIVFMGRSFEPCFLFLTLVFFFGRVEDISLSGRGVLYEPEPRDILVGGLSNIPTEYKFRKSNKAELSNSDHMGAGLHIPCRFLAIPT